MPENNDVTEGKQLEANEAPRPDGIIVDEAPLPPKAKRLLKDKKTVAIFTNFQDSNESYSLIGIAISQARMLLRMGHKVYYVVCETYNDGYDDASGLSDLIDAYPTTFKVLYETKFGHLRDYETSMLFTQDHKDMSKEAAEIYAELIVEFGIDVVYTHDFIFTGWNLPYAAAVKQCSEMLFNKHKLIIKWLHWIHSIPSGNRDWWDMKQYGPGHFIVFPNRVEINRVAESFKTTPSSIYSIPHIKDIRHYYDFSQEALDITYTYPTIMTSEVVQVYPCSADRMKAKQLDVIIKLLAEMKKIGSSVFLCVINQWATGRQSRESVKTYIDLATSLGLEYGEDFIFTSEYSEKFQKGLPRRVLRDLQLVSNLFVFPTMEESFGLVGPEAAYSGALVVSNRSLAMMYEVLSTFPPSFEFGSFHQFLNKESDEEWEVYWRNVAYAIMNRLLTNEAVMTKTYCRTRYCEDYLYSRHYLPAMA